MVSKRAKLFWTGRSQAVRLPQEFRFEGEVVSVRREGRAVILEPVDEWPDGYIASFAATEIERPAQPELEQRGEIFE
jgi:antitoxin VapB